MTKLLSRKPKPDPALARYPQALAELLTFGEPEKDLEYEDWADKLGDHVPDLIRMILDEDLNSREDDDPALWSPIHALRVLCILGPIEAAKPLLACLGWDEDWVVDALTELYTAIGPASVPVLRDYLFDPSHDARGRSTASNALMAIAQEHESAHSDIVALLTGFLDRPEADASADEEEITTSVIYDLSELGDPTAYDAIRRAYAEDRVSPHIIGLDDVEIDFGMRPSIDHSKPGKPRTGPGVRLDLRCKACGREREYIFSKVYYDLGTHDDEKKRKKYSPVVIPQRVVCRKCGAVDQYELGAMGHIAVTASMLAQNAPRDRQLLREDQRVQFINFTSQWGPMHPQEAIERYERELARRPGDPSLRVGFGNVLRFLDRFDEAEAQYQRALDSDPRHLEAWICLAQVAGQRHDIPGAVRGWQRVKELAVDSTLPQSERLALVEEATDNLSELRGGRIPEYVPNSGRERLTTQPQPKLPTSRQRSPLPKVGRNEPVPAAAGRSTNTVMAVMANRSARGQGS